jgi:hypothetical protein
MTPEQLQLLEEALLSNTALRLEQHALRKALNRLRAHANNLARNQADPPEWKKRKNPSCK